jgi:hypothetical protein
LNPRRNPTPWPKKAKKADFDSHFQKFMRKKVPYKRPDGQLCLLRTPALQARVMP